mgnify:CR=1 FL=1|jgi:hypothetical protein|tara:strand:- start:1830 stop:2711 length:882 start_codon:yes stop_codon:yes gene_type:complete
MNRTLRRPMFRMGGSTGEGITSGLQAPRQNYATAGDVKKIKAQRDLINQLAPRTQRTNTNFNDFLINMGLDLVSRPRGGNIFQQVATSAREPFAQFQKGKQLQEAYSQQAESEERSMITELVKNLSDADMSRAQKLANDMIASGMLNSDGEKMTYAEALQEAVGSIVYGVKKEPGELRAETIDTRAGVLIKQDEDLGYDSAMRVAEAAQEILDGKIEGITKDDIDTDQLFIETETLTGMDLDEDGTLTLPTETTEISIGFDQYIDGMVYYNYRDGKFYRKSGKQFIPIQQPES